MKELKDYEEKVTDLPIDGSPMPENNGFVFPTKEKVAEQNKKGTFFDFDIPGLGLLKLKIRFVTPTEVQGYRKAYVVKKINKKTGRLDEYEDDDRRFETSQKMILDAVTGWENIADKDGKPTEFNRENLMQLIDIIGLQEVTELDEDGDAKTVMRAIIDCMKDSNAHFGEKKN